MALDVRPRGGPERNAIPRLDASCSSRSEARNEPRGHRRRVRAELWHGGRLPKRALEQGSDQGQHLARISIPLHQGEIRCDIEAQSECIAARQATTQQLAEQWIMQHTNISLRSRTVDPARVRRLLDARPAGTLSTRREELGAAGHAASHRS
jgi:hypothetical protein